MTSLCPKHKIKLNIEEGFLRIHGKSYLVTKGLCAQCETVYINRAIFPGNAFNFEDVRYETLDTLGKRFPYDAAKEAEQIAIEEAKKKKAQQEKNQKKQAEKQAAKLKAKKAEAARQLEKILKKNPQHAVNVVSIGICERVPSNCPRDDIALTYVKNVHHKKWKISGMCCLVCKRLFLTHEQLAKFKEECAPSKLSHPNNHPKKAVAPKTPNSAPVCHKETELPKTKIKHLPDSTILVAKIRRLDMKAERTVVVVTAAEDQNSSSGIYWIGRSMSAAVLSAIQIDPQRRFENKGIPYEVVSYKGSNNLPKYLEIISRFCKPTAPQTIHIFAHKHISKFQGEDYEAVTAMIPCADKAFPVATTVYYEKKTSRYFMNENNYKDLRDRYGLPHLRLRAAADVVPFGDGFAALKPNSELNLLGYNVNATEGLTTAERRKKLQDIIDTGALKKVEVMNHIEWCIKSHKNILNHENAVSKWKEDLLFVQKYKANAQRIVWIKNLQSKYSSVSL